MDGYLRKLCSGKIRAVRTHSERRAASAAVADGVRVRPKRGMRMLPTRWDDQFVVAQKSWKWFRKNKH